MHRVQLGGILQELPWRIKELLSTGSFSGALFWKHKKKFILFKLRESKKIKRLPWLNCNHLSLLKCKTRTTPEMKKCTKTC